MIFRSNSYDLSLHIKHKHSAPKTTKMMDLYEFSSKRPETSYNPSLLAL